VAEKSDGDSLSEESENNTLELLDCAAPEKDASCKINRANKCTVTTRIFPPDTWHLIEGLPPRGIVEMG
jgi:hypothetical protein